MATVMYEVTNNGNAEHEEMFKNRIIRIPAGGSIKMPKSDANQFLAQMAVSDKGRLKEKKLSAKRIGQEQENELICNFCGKADFKNRDEYLVHLNAHAKNRYSNDELDKELERKKDQAQKSAAFTCPFCDFTASNELAMKRHIKKEHLKRGRKIKGAEEVDGSNADEHLRSGAGAGGGK